ncbi:hypothetical protein C1280_20555 [Gemmata obscuriglobus]|uniref:Protein kinase domain-containing protein n=1 Tax=Gemmata obscuriglobus TaxID=114 RepID=A0A2Z3GXC9_9BACT|nr:hypothetical protein C1280_20555 [Gemmata obscuriglobus]
MTRPARELRRNRPALFLSRAPRTARPTANRGVTSLVTTGSNQRSSFTTGQHKMAGLGEKTKSVLESLLDESARIDDTFHPLAKLSDEDWAAMATALDHPWTDENAASLLSKLIEQLSNGPQSPIDCNFIVKFIRAHQNDPDAVIDCINLIPPEGFTIISAMSRTGSQKRVYHAKWKQAQREVVLKRLLGNRTQQELILDRELQSHPLAMRHPNIIATHPLQNVKGDKFLVEEKLPFALNDAWRANGTHEAANLLYDIAQAIAYLHGELALVHGDIKPDNIGQKDGSYILLDFGICRTSCDFTHELSVTGSLRTRAPELFEDGPYPSEPRKFDVWALGATVYKAVTGSFLFIDDNERVPRTSTPAERKAFEGKIRDRMRTQWEQRVRLDSVPDPLRAVLARALVAAPERRATAKELVHLCGQKLGAFLSGIGSGSVAIETELEQLLQHLPRTNAVLRMPAASKQRLRERLRQLRTFSRAARGRESEIDALIELLG